MGATCCCSRTAAWASSISASWARCRRRSMAALREMGVAADVFDEAAFASDLKKAIEATEANDAAAIVNDVIAVSENNNLVLPSEFGLLTKQAIYLNRYVTTLAPDLDPFAEDVLGGPV